MESLSNIIGEIFKDEIPIFALYLTIPLLIEGFITRVLQKRKFSIKDGPATICIGLVEVVTTGVSLYYLNGLFTSIENYKLFHIERDWFYFLMLAVVCEFTFYSSHWAGHYYRWFWNEHQVHHSTTEMNLFAGNRTGWTFLLAGLWMFAIPFVFKYPTYLYPILM